ncbi:MAG: hypothetical protein RSD14_06035 [Clostridia bacterium]
MKEKLNIDKNRLDEKQDSNYGLVLGVCLGMIFGLFLGKIVFKSTGMGIAVGIGVGLVIGILYDLKNAKIKDSADANREIKEKQDNKK